MVINRDFIDSVLGEEVGNQPAPTPGTPPQRGWNGEEEPPAPVPPSVIEGGQHPFDAVADDATRAAFIWSDQRVTAGFDDVNRQLGGIFSRIEDLKRWVESIALGRITGEAEVGRAGINAGVALFCILGGAFLGWLGFWLLASGFEQAIEAATEHDFVVPWGFWLGAVVAGGLLGLAVAAQGQKTVIRLRRWVTEPVDVDQPVDESPTVQLNSPPAQNQVA